MKRFVKVSYKGAFCFSLLATLMANALLFYLMAFLQHGRSEMVKQDILNLSEINVIKKSRPEPLIPEPRLSVAKRRKPLKKIEIKKTKLVDRKKSLRPLLISMNKPVPELDISPLIPLDFNSVVPLQKANTSGSGEKNENPDSQDISTTTDNRIKSVVSSVEGIYNQGDVDQGPIQLTTLKPVYPPMARRLGFSGWVVLGFIVTDKGNVESIHIRSSDGRTIFEKAAISAVRKWRFRPARLKGRPVSVRCRKKIIFHLED